MILRDSPELHMRIGNMFVLIARIGIGAVFMYAGVLKMRQPQLFLASVYDYELVGPLSGQFVAMTVPAIEVCVGMALFLGVFVEGALLLSSLLCAAFALAVGSAIYRGLGISCGCFGFSGERIGYATLFRALAMFVAAIFAYRLALTSHRLCCTTNPHPVTAELESAGSEQQ